MQTIQMKWQAFFSQKIKKGLHKFGQVLSLHYNISIIQQNNSSDLSLRMLFFFSIRQSVCDEAFSLPRHSLVVFDCLSVFCVISSWRRAI